MLRVRHYEDETFEVYNTGAPYESLFRGSLAECEAFVRLTHAGLLD